jgi:Ca2+-binding RTX toxin-like protein
MLMADPFDSTKMELVADGAAGNDNISFLAAAGGKVSVNMNGKMFGPFAVTSRLISMGGAGNDVISVAPAITLPSFLYAGTGIDRLTGGGGQNTLVGGGGTVTLIGGPTRNVLIAGGGKATIYSSKLGTAVGANSGSLMIAGSTNFDQNDSALSAIMHEWGSSDTYATRISKIRNGQVAAGVALNSTTVHPTAHVVDQLYASSGGYDWFLNYGLTSQMLGIDPHKKSLIQIN